MSDKGKVKVTFTLPEIALYFRVCERTIIRWCKSGKIPHYKVGKAYRFDFEEVKKQLSNDSELKKLLG
jgi:excisionase family DNA binding protein